MAGDSPFESRYAGDAAWREWFDVCSVAGCSAEHAAPLGAQVTSAMHAQLVRAGLRREDAGTDDPVAFFDSYFKLKGAREKPKPLKAYFAYRIEKEGLALKDFVCGTLFGSLSGRIHDIVTDWIATLKGWKPRTVRGADGRRHAVWEGAAPEDVAALELPVTADPAAMMDAEPLRRALDRMLEDVSRKIKVEKAKVALLLYATAQDVSLTESAVLEGLETGKSRAYAMREKAMTELRRELAKGEWAEHPLFARTLVEVCEHALDPSVRAQLGGAQ